jgi:predicted acylesterase/phospholipase RssA
MSKQFNLLSLSGGGIRGLFTVSVLANIETYICEQKGIDVDQANKYSVAQHFDLICGTSIGGIIALGLASGLTARHLKKVMLKKRLEIFPKKPKGLAKLGKLFSPTYQASPLKSVLDDLFQDKKIGDLQKYILIPSISISNGQVRAFKTPHHPHLHTDYKLSVVDVALATSAAPTYFPIHSINKERFVDGGLAANSPVLMGLIECEHYLNRNLTDVYVMQVGTMGSKRTSDHSEKLNGGYFKTWELGGGIIDLAMSSTETLHDFLATKILHGADRILRFDEQPGEKKSNVLALDNASDQAMEILTASADKVAREQINNPKFKRFMEHIADAPKFHFGTMKNSEETR